MKRFFTILALSISSCIFSQSHDVGTDLFGTIASRWNVAYTYNTYGKFSFGGSVAFLSKGANEYSEGIGWGGAGNPSQGYSSRTFFHIAPDVRYYVSRYEENDGFYFLSYFKYRIDNRKDYYYGYPEHTTDLLSNRLTAGLGFGNLWVIGDGFFINPMMSFGYAFVDHISLSNTDPDFILDNGVTHPGEFKLGLSIGWRFE